MADKKISQLTGATTPVAGTEVLPIVQGGNTVKVSIANLTAGRSISSAGASLDGAVTINDSGADVDFRVEGDTDANLLFADASTDRIGIGTNSPAYKLDVTAAGASTAANVFSMARITGADAVANDLTLVGPNTSQVRVKFGDPDSATVGEIGYDNATNSLRFLTNGNQVAIFDSSGKLTAESGATFNESGADSDFRVEGDTDANMIFGDASADSVGIGTNAPNSKLHVKGASAAIPPVKVENAQPTGIALVSDRYAADESLMQIGLGFSTANLVVGSAVGPSTTTQDTFISTQDTFATFGAAISVATGDGSVRVFSGASATTVTTGNNKTLVERAAFTPTAAIINESGADVDFRVEGDTDANLLFVDASTDRVGLGTNAPQQKLEVVGNLRFSGSQVGTKIQPRQTGISVTTSATTIIDDAGGYGSVVVVNGEAGGDRFCDLLFASTAASPTVISSFAAFGSPAARTYTRSGGALQLAMASGTYNVWALALGY